MRRLHRLLHGLNPAAREARAVVAELVYTRVSTVSTQRQTRPLAEAGLVDGADRVWLFADSATSSKIPAASTSWPASRGPTTR